MSLFAGVAGLAALAGLPCSFCWAETCAHPPAMISAAPATSPASRRAARLMARKKSVMIVRFIGAVLYRSAVSAGLVDTTGE